MKDAITPFESVLEEVKTASQVLVQRNVTLSAVEYAEQLQLHWKEHEMFSKMTVREAMHFHRFVEILETSPECVGM